jgi:hypothetical protein
MPFSFSQIRNKTTKKTVLSSLSHQKRSLHNNKNQSRESSIFVFSNKPVFFALPCHCKQRLGKGSPAFAKLTSN